jgi:hypothetical protein
MVNEKKMQFAPFHAINEFMRDDFRLAILQEVITHAEDCDKNKVLRMNRLFAKGVQIPGFRNSSMAPMAVRIKHSVDLFEKSAEFSALIIDCWSERHGELKKAVQQLLDQKNWKPLPADADRTLLPGFQLDWPKGDNFEVFINAIKEAYPESNESDDNVSLMVVWIGNKLPYNLFDEPESEV